MTQQKLEVREHVELDVNGEKIFGMIHLPQQTQKAPAVLFCHGYAGTKIGSQRMFVLLAEQLSKAGIVALRFDCRGSGDSEGDFQAMTISREIEDTVRMLEFLGNHPKVDPTKIGLLGRSLGSVIAVLTSKLLRNTKSLALWSPIFDSDQWKEDLQNHIQNPNVDLKGGGAPVVKGHRSNFVFLKEFFSLQMDKDIQSLSHVPLLLVHGEKDKTVHFAQTEKYELARKSAKAETKLIRLPNTDHYYCDVQERDTIVQETAKWFAKTLS